MILPHYMVWVRWVGVVYDLHFIVLTPDDINYYLYNLKNEILSGRGGFLLYFFWAYTNLKSFIIWINY